MLRIIRGTKTTPALLAALLDAVDLLSTSLGDAGISWRVKVTAELWLLECRLQVGSRLDELVLRGLRSQTAFSMDDRLGVDQIDSRGMGFMSVRPLDNDLGDRASRCRRARCIDVNG